MSLPGASQKRQTTYLVSVRLIAPPTKTIFFEAYLA